MELWIRSQDRKTLLKMNRIYVFSQTIFAEYIDNREIDLGTYKTNERALEVLDEIQHRLITLCDSMNRHLYVYEMPQE